MCNLERWLCSKCVGRFIVFEYPCEERDEICCPHPTFSESLISSQYCYECSETRREQWYCDDTEVLNQMIRAKTSIRVDGKVPFVVDVGFLYFFENYKTIDFELFAEDHPALYSESTIAHFNEHLTPLRPSGPFYPPAIIIPFETSDDGDEAASQTSEGLESKVSPLPNLFSFFFNHTLRRPQDTVKGLDKQ
ncbi:hypothetical protein GGR54DRAFT_343202 [Hypoxylon sp. NC1633]|nr:hypothetical protein GGR54DRAFT_343202 [Hypoxylon sp. NC1633]